ncbi:hypothetical protein NL676_019385 [Syzygium grande]|nr:hypothetical protein NL676_019385 [Syzygium grande]
MARGAGDSEEEDGALVGGGRQSGGRGVMEMYGSLGKERVHQVTGTDGSEGGQGAKVQLDRATAARGR